MKMISTLEGSVRLLSDRMLKYMHVPLTPDEFVATYIRPEHVGVLHETEAACGFIGSTSGSLASGVDNLRLYVSFIGRPPIILPEYIKNEIQPDAPPEVVKRIRDFATQRVELGNKFGTAIDALYWLNGNCRDVNSFRVMFPALPALLNQLSDDPKSVTSKQAARLASVRNFAPLPAISQEGLQAMREASALLQAASMLPKPEITSYGTGAPGEAIVTFASYSVRQPNTFKTHGTGSFV
jgi:hypothetical protein